MAISSAIGQRTRDADDLFVYQAISDLASGSDSIRLKSRHALERELLSTRSALRRALGAYLCVCVSLSQATRAHLRLSLCQPTCLRGNSKLRHHQRRSNRVKIKWGPSR